MKTIKFFTLGCKVNQYDTQSIRERFLENGFKELSDGEPADFCLVNTCTVTQRSDADSLGLLRRAKRENPKAKILVTGCLAELDYDRIKSACPSALIVRNIGKDLSLFLGLRTTNDERRTTSQAISYFKGHTRAFLKIQDGCDNFCSYCKVPLVRGGSRSKGLKQVIREAAGLAENGFKEIVLCGICLGAYGRDLDPKASLIDAVGELGKIPHLARIRLSSIEAGDVSTVLIDKMARSKKLCRHLHIPVQSGDDAVLKKMRRKYTHSSYLKLIRRIRRWIPDIAITTDCLVGFPGEGEAEFKNTCELVRKIRPSKAHIFPYSERQGTQAAGEAQNKVSPAIVKERIARLKKIADACALDFRRKFLNRRMVVLIEARAKARPGYWVGHTDNYLKVMVKLRGDFKNQEVALRLKSIEGEVVIGEKEGSIRYGRRQERAVSDTALR